MKVGLNINTPVLTFKLITLNMFALLLLDTVISNNSTSMQLIKLVQFMFWTKLWPVKMDSQGILKHDLFHPATIMPWIFSVISASIVMYFTFPVICEKEFTKLSQIWEVGMFLGSLISYLPSILLLQKSIRKMDTSVCGSRRKLDRNFYVKLRQL